jgi:hypothetical protein
VSSRVNDFDELRDASWVWLDTVRRETTTAYYTFTTDGRSENKRIDQSAFVRAHGDVIIECT